MDVLREVVLPRLEGLRPSGAGYDAKCPAHDDGRASLSVSVGVDHPVVLHCHAGCDRDAVLEALGLTWQEICQPSERREEAEWTPRGPAVAVYDYVDEGNNLLFQVCRTADKQFPQRRPDPTRKTGWNWKLGDVRRVPYRLPQLLEALENGSPIYVVEGEKDVQTLERQGLVATCSPGGAGKWKGEYDGFFVEADVTIVADQDGPGEKHARTVASALTGVASKVRIVQARTGKDASDHFAAGHTLDEFVEIWSKAQDDTEASDRLSAHEVAAEARKLRVREQARRLVRREQRESDGRRPQFVLGSDFLAEPDPPISYRLDELWPSGGRILLAAQYKAGKTTLLGNCIRSLVDAEPFLDRFEVSSQARRVALLDNELDRNMLRRWLREQDIQRTDLFAPVSLRGKLSTFDILDPEVRAEWAADLRAIGADVVVLDCLRPVLDALGLDENREAGRFLTAFDELLGEAGVGEAIVVHHMGHNGERSRGDSRLRDWPDAEWRLVREDLDDPSSPRYFSAFGRDVDVPESRLEFDLGHRRLTIAGGSRRDAKVERCLGPVLDILRGDDAREGLSQRQIIERALEAGAATKAEVPKVLSLAKRQGLVNNWTGPRRADMYSLKLAVAS